MATGSIDERSGEIKEHERWAYFAGVRRLQDLHTRLAAATNLHAAFDEILAAALELTGTDRGCLALVSDDSQRWEMVAHYGYAPESGFLRHFLNHSSERTWNAVRRREGVVIDDVKTLPSLLGTKHREVMLAEDIRSMQCTPITTFRGEMVGVLSTQFRQPHRRADDELPLAAMLARIAAELVERHRRDAALRSLEARQADDSAALRESEQRLRGIFEQNLAGIAEADLSGRFVSANRRYC
ncbi:MAG: GAF domain-containing protein, partial [Nitrococcus sp.]|nr:GAF domain-containing protein [Nitrococcus sp.]